MTESDRERELAEVLQEIFDRRARGEQPTLSEYVERYPHYRRELAEHFETLEALDRIVRGRGAPVSEQTVLGDFRMLREIGRGGMGVVFLAEQVSLHRVVALKLLDRPLAQAYRTIERFRREAEIAGRLHHPNLVSVYAVGEAHGYSYFAMEYVAGVSLAQVLARLRELGPSRLPHVDLAEVVREIAPPVEADLDDTDTPTRPLRPVGYFGLVAQLAADVAEGLAYAHARNVVHRDVKPSNILVDRHLAPHLADFGLAKEIGGETLSITGDLLGTPYYMSPEIAMAGRIQVDHRTDLYSLGVTLFELLTLRVPFAGSTSQEVLRRIVLESPPAPRRLNRSVPRDLSVIALKAMEKNPAHRYASAVEMAEDLRRFLRFEPIRATPPGPLRIAGRYLRRHSVAAGFAALLVAATGVAIAAVNSMVHREAIARTLAAARGQEERGELLEAERTLESGIEEFGGEVPDARAGLERIREKKAQRAAVLESEGDGLARRGRTVEAGEAYGRALLLGAGEPVRRKYEEATGVFRVGITSEPQAARVWHRDVDAETGALFPPRSLGTTPIEGLPLDLGWHRLVLVDEEGRSGEYSIEISRQRPTRSLHARLRAPDLTRMRRVEGGAYRIGDRPSRGGPSAFEPREVEVASFWIDELEVANREYAEFVRDSGHPPPPDWPEGTCPPEKLDLPVVYVSWEDARAFAEWAGKRLPTDVEWEVACRGKESKRYPWGNDFDPGRANLPLTGTEMPQAGAREIPPAPLIPGGRMLGDRSDWGVMDLIGNVREWTWSPWTPRADADFEITPELRRPGERAIRGSSFYGPPLPKGCACTNRESLPPHDRDDHTGIRCAKSVDPLADIP